MQTPQELLATAQEFGVATYETSKQLDWQNPTKYVWVRTAYNEITVMSRKELEYEKTLLDMTDGIGYSSVVCAAPQMHEIFRCFSQIRLVTIQEYLWVSYVKYPIHIPIHDHHYAQAYAELYLKLKPENLLCKS
jgi:hypothetical protein